MFKKLASISLAALLLLAVAGCGGAKNKGADKQAANGVKWPKHVEIVVPASAGGDSDFNARLLAQKLTKKLGTNFVVSNVNGNGGATGTRQVKDAKNDGSSILFYHTAFLVNKASKAADYGFDAYNFASIAAQNPGNCVVVNTKLGVKTLADLKKYADEHPDQLKLAVQTGATSYAVGAMMQKAGFKLKMVDAGSAADRLTALLGGHVDVIFAPYGSIRDYVKEGTMLPLAMDGEHDLKIADQNLEIKTMKSLGFDAQLPFYYFFAFPKGTNQALVDSFNAALQDIINKDKEYQDKIYKSYFQKPFFAPGKEGLDKYAAIEAGLKTISFSKVQK